MVDAEKWGNHLPHTRGDEPPENYKAFMEWVICPTRVGMNRRRIASGNMAFYHLPHTRGDEPVITWQHHTAIMNLPHTRGDEPVPPPETPEIVMTSAPHAWG